MKTWSHIPRPEEYWCLCVRARISCLFVSKIVLRSVERVLASEPDRWLPAAQGHLPRLSENSCRPLWKFENFPSRHSTLWSRHRCASTGLTCTAMKTHILLKNRHIYSECTCIHTFVVETCLQSILCSWIDIMSSSNSLWQCVQLWVDLTRTKLYKNSSNGSLYATKFFRFSHSDSITNKHEYSILFVNT
jgi:hypothetical protein